MWEAPELAADPQALREALANVQALIAPPSVAIDAHMLLWAPALRAVARTGAAQTEHIDLEACERAGIEVVRGGIAHAAAQAEFVVGALLSLLRGIAPAEGDGAAVVAPPLRRELGGATVGLLGMQAPSRLLSNLLAAFGSRVVGYDPSLHASDELWDRWQVEPLPLREFIAECDAVCVLLPMFSRYRGLLGERLMSGCKHGQVIVSLTDSTVFDEAALADAMGDGRVAAAWFDRAESGLLQPGRPLAGRAGVQVTASLADSSRDARVRSAWHVARRIDTLLGASRGRQVPGLTGHYTGMPPVA